MSVDKCINLLTELKNSQNGQNVQLNDDKLRKLMKIINLEDTNIKKTDLLLQIIINKLMNRELISDSDPKRLMFDAIKESPNRSAHDTEYITTAINEIDLGFKSFIESI